MCDAFDIFFLVVQPSLVIMQKRKNFVLLCHVRLQFQLWPQAPNRHTAAQLFLPANFVFWHYAFNYGKI